MAKAQVGIFVLFALVGVPARAEWYAVGTSVNNSTWYMDPDRLKVVGNRVQAWVKIDSRRDRTVQWSESKELISFDCRADTSKTLSLIKYDSYGKTISSSSVPDYGSGYEPVVPDSIGETVERLACKAIPGN